MNGGSPRNADKSETRDKRLELFPTRCIIEHSKGDVG